MSPASEVEMFLRRRIAEDEARVRRSRRGWRRLTMPPDYADRLLSAMRTLVYVDDRDLRVRVMASVYRDHPDWREEWRP